MSDILVATSAGGRQCSHFLPLLTSGSSIFKLRLAAHSENSAAKLRTKYPDAEVVVVDLVSLSECRELVRGASAVFHAGPSIHSREREMGLNMIDAATAESQTPGSRFRHFVLSTVLGTQHRKLMQHDLKSYVEERLMLSPIPWTILQPTNFMDSYPVAKLAAMETPVMERMWSPDVANSVIALRDLAEATAKVLIEGEKHYYAQYPLCSTAPISDSEVVEIIGRQIGRDVRVNKPSFEKGVDFLMHMVFGSNIDNAQSGFGIVGTEGDLRPDISKDKAERLVLFYNRYGLVGNPNVLRWLLGREPTSVEEWVNIKLAEAKFKYVT
ncbi:Putative NmrA-like domain, NAD(P)-binding domain superfamily [Colletotrichum destructivum]|uniref:NmrA-like domain, NAD(P)-binding domain superfamily n=1 Tax=Colletotrichum destructivum TaxID=34406 RepID=A0AAX4IPD7_9PEZI|nr:Putative NmrA-like domain, NAD(P)-binding domain superfamily [Colletotrichum destructivum]